jgi:hypothetical protein
MTIEIDEMIAASTRWKAALAEPADFCDFEPNPDTPNDPDQRAWLARNEFRFVAGTSWSQKPDCDWTDDPDFEEQGCSIYLFVNGRKYKFVLDAKIAHTDTGHPLDMVRMMAEVLAETLTQAARDLDWRLRNLPYFCVTNYGAAGPPPSMKRSADVAAIVEQIKATAPKGLTASPRSTLRCP